MAFDPDKYLAKKSTGFDPDAYLAKTTPAQATAQPVKQEASGIRDFFTGENRTTPEIKNLQEIGAAPELNKMSVPAFKASLGLLTTGDTDSLKRILSEQFGQDVSYEDDQKGNTIVNLPSGKYVLNAPGVSGQDVVRTVFDFLSFTPAGRAGSIPGAIAKSAATQGAIEGAKAEVGGGFDLKNVAFSGALGGAFKGIEDVAGAASRAMRGGAANDVVEAGREAGIPVLTSDVRQPQTFAGKMAQQTGEKIPVFGTGGIREAQQKMREDAVSEVADKYGTYSYQAIVDSLKTQKNKLKTAAGNTLEATGQKLDAIGPIPLDATKTSIRMVTDELTKPGVLKSSKAIDDLLELSKTLDEAPQTFTTLKENRTAFREIANAVDQAGRSQLPSRAKSLIKRVENSMTRDMEDFARKSLSDVEFRRWKNANAVYADEAAKMTKTKIKNILDSGDMTPEKVTTMLFSKQPSEVKTLYTSLTNEGRQNARSAIISKVVGDLSRRQSGLTPNSFATEMNKYGLQTDVFFKGEEKRQLSGLLKALNATRRAQEASITTPTGQQVLGAGTALSLFTNPVETVAVAGTTGGLARLYESAPVRNALLRLDSVPVGSTQFEQALREVFAVLQPAAQTARQEAEGMQ